jgi:hypothetical protein
MNGIPFIIMDSQQEHLMKVKILGDSETRQGFGEVRIAFWDKKKRMFRALRIWAIFWGGAIVAVFIPLMHFILVPALLLVGPIAAYFVSKQESAILGGQGICPNCQAPLEIAQAKYQFPMEDLCSKCQGPLKIFKDAA